MLCSREMQSFLARMAGVARPTRHLQDAMAPEGLRALLKDYDAPRLPFMYWATQETGFSKQHTKDERESVPARHEPLLKDVSPRQVNLSLSRCARDSRGCRLMLLLSSTSSALVTYPTAPHDSPLPEQHTDAAHNQLAPIPQVPQQHTDAGLDQRTSAAVPLTPPACEPRALPHISVSAPATPTLSLAHPARLAATSPGRSWSGEFEPEPGQCDSEAMVSLDYQNGKWPVDLVALLARADTHIDLAKLQGYEEVRVYDNAAYEDEVSEGMYDKVYDNVLASAAVSIDGSTSDLSCMGSSDSEAYAVRLHWRGLSASLPDLYGDQETDMSDDRIAVTSRVEATSPEDMSLRTVSAAGAGYQAMRYVSRAHGKSAACRTLRWE